MNNNVLEFFVKMKDLMSGGLGKLAGNAQQTFGKIQNYIDQTVNHTNRLSSSFGDVNNSVTKAGMSLGGFVRMIGIAAAATAAFAFAKDSVGKAMEFGATKESFKVLTGSDKTGVGLANDLNKLQQDTVLGPAVFQNAKTMLGFGIATEKILPTMKMLGDVSMGDADKMERLTLAFSQTNAAGRLMGQDLLQYINAGFNPLNQISKDTGISMGVLKKKMEEGAISSQMVEQAFKNATGEGGLFNNMLEKIGETPFGKMQQLQGQWESFKIQLGEALMPLATVGMQALQGLLQLSQTFIPYIVQGVQWVLDLFTSLQDPTSAWGGWISIISEYVGIIWEGLKSVFAMVWHIVGGIIEWLGKSQIIKDLFSVISTIAGVLWEVIKAIASVLTWIWDNIIKPVLEAIEWVYNKIKSILGLATEKPIEIKGTVSNNTLVTVAANTSVADASKAFTGNSGGLVAATKAAGDNPYASLTKNSGKEKGSGDASRAVASGGPRVINISGVNMKLADKLDIYAMDVEDALNKLETKGHEMMLRLLNSGASVQ